MIYSRWHRLRAVAMLDIQILERERILSTESAHRLRLAFYETERDLKIQAIECGHPFYPEAKPQ